jgi:hypothetical protein
MPDADYLALGQWNAICDRCGRKFKSSRLRPTWDGLMVCERDWEPRHPQDFVRAAQPERQPEWVRPPSSDNYTDVCTPCGVTGIPGMAIPGCAIPGYINPMALDSCIASCTPDDTSAIPGIAVPGCVIPGFVSPFSTIL